VQVLKKQTLLIQMYLRVKTFLKGNPPPAPVTYAEQEQVLDDVVAQLGSHSTSQASGGHLSQAEIKRQQKLIEKLRVDHLRPIVAIARANVENHPGIEKALRMPAGGLGVIRLLAEAEAIRTAAALYPPVFVKDGRPENFLDQLSVAIDAVRNSTLDKGTLVGRKAGAKAGIAQELRRGRKALTVLDSIVQSAFAGNDVVLREWEVAKKLRATAVVGSAATPQPTTTAPSTTSPSTGTAATPVQPAGSQAA
jgi:hypothetical protein